MTDSPAALDETLDRELEGLARELAEIELLVGQSRTEAGRHEQKRAQAADRLAGLGPGAPAAELARASFEVRSRPANGTVVVLDVPVPDEGGSA